MNGKSIPGAGGLIGIMLMGLTGTVPAQSTSQPTLLKDALEAQHASQLEAREIQARINALDDQTRELLEEYRGLMRRQRDLTEYNRQMTALVDDQDDAIAQRQKQLDDIVEMQERIAPFLRRMIDVLGEFVALDTPFLRTERAQRIDLLERMMRRSDVSIPEKYRRIMEAYRIEAEYGHGLEAYEDTLELDGESWSVQFLRLGRAGLYSLTLDGRQARYWSRGEGRWVTLDRDAREALETAIRVARKQSAPELIMLPVDAPEVAPEPAS